ncbi:methyl-accepting chemotaxis protein, partial [Helicobacter muridarum]
MHNLRLGTKITIFVFISITICLAISTYIAFYYNKKLFIENSSIIMQNAAKRVANLLTGRINESFAVLNISSSNIEDYLQRAYIRQDSQDNINTRLKNEIISMVDKNTWANYGYMIITENSRYNQIIKNNVILVQDDNVYEPGGAKTIEDINGVLGMKGYKEAIETGKPSISPPNFVRLGGKERFVFSMNIPIKHQDRVEAVVGMTIDIDLLTKDVSSPDFYLFGGGYITILDENGLTLYHNSGHRGVNFADYSRSEGAQTILQFIKEGVWGKSIEYENSQGHDYIGTVATFNFAHSISNKFGVIYSIPQEVITAGITTVRNISIIGAVICALICIIIIFILTKSFILDNIILIQTILFNFFKYLNHETNQPPALVQIKSQDELGRMAEAINSNIQRTQKSLEQDAILVSQVVEIVNDAKNGKFGNNITQTSLNPEINKLRDTLNEMSKTLFNLVGDDLTKAKKVFDGFESNDFTPRIDNPMGLEKSLNKLGDSICRMLSVSRENAKELESQSKELENAVNTLSESSNKQASSLEETA